MRYQILVHSMNEDSTNDIEIIDSYTHETVEMLKSALYGIRIDDEMAFVPVRLCLRQIAMGSAGRAIQLITKYFELDVAA